MKKRMKLVTICVCMVLLVVAIATSELGNGSALADVSNQGADTLVTTTADGKTTAAAPIEVIYLPTKHTLKIGEIMEWNPNPDNGSWEYFTKYLEHIPGSKPTQFRAKAAGTTTLKYMSEGYSHTIDVTIVGTAEQIGVKGLPDTYIVGIGGQVQFDPSPTDGVWEYVPDMLQHIEGSVPTAFKAVSLGETTLAYITKEGLRCHIDITITEKPPTTESSKPAESSSSTQSSSSGSSTSSGSSSSSKSSSSSSSSSSTSSSSTSSAKPSSTSGTKVTDLPSTYKMKVGDSVTWNPVPRDGSWTYNAEYFEYVAGSNPASFKAVKEGTFVVKYKLTNGTEYSINVTVTK